jgi:hypothetical protein
MNYVYLKDKRSLIKIGCGLLLAFFILDRLALINADPDLWGYLAFGKLFWNSNRFPYQDVFSYLPTLHPWVYHEWLTGVLFYPIYKFWGFSGLQFLKYCFALATMGLVYITARKRGGQRLAVALFIILIMRGFIYYGYSPVRAQLFTYFFFALTLYLLETARQTHSWRRLWLLVPIQIFWCNLHGGFLAGLGLVALYALGEAISRRPFLPYLGVLVVSGLATLINPYGLNYWYYLIHAISMPRPQIAEWGSIYHLYKTGDISIMPIINLLVMVILILLLAWRNQWRELTPALCLVLVMYLGLTHIRHMVFVYLLIGAYIPVLLNPYLEGLRSPGKLAEVWDRYRRHPGLVLAVIAASLGFFGYHFFQKAPFSLKTLALPASAQAVPGNYYPLGAVNYIQKHDLSGKLLTEFGWGEYLIWTLHPRCYVSPDGRYETVYPSKVIKQFFAWDSGKFGWRTFVNHYPPDMILIDSRSKLYREIHEASQWRQVYADAGCALFLRPQGQNAHKIQMRTTKGGQHSP